jgi:hypothetical protein
MTISYENRGYQLEVYPFYGNIISISDFESKDSLEDIIEVVERILNNINLTEDCVYFSSNCNSEKRRVLSIEDIRNFAEQDFSQYLR